MRILLTNDDGYDAPGIAALYRAVRDLGDVSVVAPMRVQSAMSHAVTFHRPLTTRPCVLHDGHDKLCDAISVDGKPADCVKLAVNYLHGDVDLVLSGINAGANVGVNVTYSGTVGAAREAAILGIPAIAISLHIGDQRKTDWESAARYAGDVLRVLIGDMFQSSVPTSFLNINLPILDDGQAPQGVRMAPLSCSPLIDFYNQQHQDDGACEYTVGSTIEFRDRPAGSDVDLLFQRYTTVTPLTLDATDHTGLEQWMQHQTEWPG